MAGEASTTSDAASPAFVLPADEDLGAAAALTPSDQPPPLEAAPSLDQIAEEAASRAAALPESEWDIPRLADALDFDPERAFTFVRDSMGFDPYPGVLRGAEGTLAARAGNAWDRALLLGALLSEMEVPFRYAFAQLDDAAAAAVAERVFLAPSAALAQPGIDLTPMFDPATIQARASRDYARLRAVLGDRVTAMDGTPSVDLADAVRQHAWVQSAFGSEWRDLDPTLLDSVAGSALTDATSTADTMPAEATQTVTARIVVETLEDGALVESTLLERRLDASAASEAEVFLYFQPAVEGVGGAVVTALGGDEEWVPVLMMDGESEVGGPFRVGGRSTDLFGEETQAPDLVSLKLVVVQDAPSRDAVTATRVLLDRVPAELRGASIAAERLLPLHADEGGPLMLARVHHIMVSTGGADRRDYSLQRQWSAEFAGTALTGEDAFFEYSWSDLLWPVAAADQSLVVASEAAVVPALAQGGAFRSFIDAPRVYVATFGRDTRDPDALAFDTDLLIDSVGLLPQGVVALGEAARRQLWYGALQTALETELTLKRAALLDPNDRTIAAVSLSGAGPLNLLAAPDLATLPAGAPGSLRQALADGFLAIVPGDPAAATVWWTVDPTSGRARSVLDPGLGGVRRTTSTYSLRAARTASGGSYGGGGGMLPRPPMQRPPPGGGGFTGAARGAPCTGGSEYTRLLCRIAIAAAPHWFAITGGIVVIVMFIVWYVI